MEEKAQVNLEYLLIIAGAVVIATAVGLFIKQSASSVTRSAQEKSAQG
ncbi:MAG: class III signal peptide-containing protein [Candidatus Diapherotrites archaeon]|nr:class III signal peptide-containing protein [Candidatus Diapherotrites archaeon]